MIIYLAGSSNAEYLKDLLRNVHFLESYYYIEDWQTEMIDQNRLGKVMVDSGAFTMRKDKTSVNWVEYAKQYGNFVRQHDIDHFVEMDIENVVGMEKMEQLRKIIENKAGKACLPVWHPERGKEYFLEMVEGYDYVGIGGMATKQTMKYRSTIEKYFPWFIRKAHKNDCKIHGFGYTDLKGLKKFNFDSVDSTTWLNGTRYGEVQKFNGQTIEKHNSFDGGRKVKDICVSNEYITRHNLKEWIKFQKYADKNL